MTDSAILAIVAVVPTVTSVFGSAAVVLAQMFREGRQRRWDEQDRARLAQQLRDDTAALALKGAADAAQLAGRVRDDHVALTATIVAGQARAEENRQAVTAAIAENTALTQEASANAKEAYHEANSVNNKIAAVGLQRIEEDRRDRRATDPGAPVTVDVVNIPLAATGSGPKKVGSSRVDLQACKLEYSIVSPK